MTTLTERHGQRVLAYPPDGPHVDAAAATELIGEALGAGADWVLIPASLLGDEFFTLRTGVAGEIVQKFVNYRLKLAILGDISAYVGRSKPLHDFVSESDRGRQLWFAATEGEFDERLSTRNPS